MLLRADWADSRPDVTLGSLILPAEHYSVQCSIAAVQMGLADGAQTEILLGEKPCQFQFSGRTAAFSAMELLVSLRAAMQTHSAFSFDFCGAAFSGMHITGCRCETDQNTKIAAYSITMTGTLTEAQPT
ncbi:MAG TPA: hypothetical protein DDX71_06355 [Ruminococcus sp.]|nr:hypothetical protein [Ruminococcus sp.]